MDLKPFLKEKNPNIFHWVIFLVDELLGDLTVFFLLAIGSQDLNPTRRGEWKAKWMKWK